jgi:flagellar biosynthesis protein FliR
MAIEVLSNEVTARFFTFVWPLTRISALALSMPVLSHRAVSLRLRVLLVLVLTWLVWPMVDWPSVDVMSARGMLWLGQEVMIGALMGLSLQMIMAAFVVGGQAMSATVGLSMANMLDPNMGQVPIIGQLLVIVGTLIFVGMDGHTMTMGLVLESFRTIPVGSEWDWNQAIRALLSWSSMVFLGGLLLALPILVTLLFINVGLGVVTRAAPSLNIFAVGFPIMLMVGLILLWVTMGATASRVQWLWMRGIQQVQTLVGLS